MELIYTMVDIVLLTIKDGQLHVVLVARDREPRKGVTTLPGGKIEEADEDALAAAFRVLKERAGIDAPYLDQLRTYSGAKRDSRRWSISIAHYALVPLPMIERSARAGVTVAPVDSMPPLPFDHGDMVAEAVARLRNRSQYSSLVAYLVGEKFKIPQLHAAYEAVRGETIKIQNFRRKLKEMDFLEEVDEEYETGRPGKPAKLYRLKSEYRAQLRMVERGF